MQNILKLLAASVVSMFLLNCASQPKDVEGPGPIYDPYGDAPKSRELDLNQVRQRLDLDRSIEDLGFTEKRFDSCQFDNAPADCGQRQFVLVHFRLQCRDSVGTVNSVSQIELMPVVSRKIKWRVGYFNGTTQTDEDGYGQVQFVAPGSSKNQRFSLQIKENSLGVTAAEVSRIIVPRDWCD
jgi:hypothetical protein